MKMLNGMENPDKVSRRNFLKGTAALGATAALYGCGSSADETVYGGGGSYPPPPDVNTDEYFYGTGGHNCGAKCLIKGWVKNGRLVRLTSSEDTYAGGVWQDPDSHNNTQSRACARCRSYVHRIYHPGRLTYPLKQTKKRGDLSGFIRISWEQALNEIARKHKAIITEYGPESILSMYACGNYSGIYQGAGANGPWNGRAGASVLLNMLGGASGYYSNYSFHQQGTFGTSFTGYGSMAGTSPNANTIATCVNTVFLWGSNCLSTVNSVANSTIQSYRKLRERGGKVIFIGPHFSDQGVNCATEWVQMKPYTDASLICAMIHEMIVNTFDKNGNVMSSPWLNPDYLDIMVHGFFDSPSYWVNKSTGEMVMNDQNDSPGGAYVWINPVPAGMSLSAYIMGSDERLTKAQYAAGDNYTAQKYAEKPLNRNMDVCSYTAGGSKVSAASASSYKRKKDYLAPKTPAWAEKICGVPAAKITELAKLFCTPAAQPIYSEWCGGQQKQAEGLNNMFALQALHIITQTYGRPGATIGRAQAGTTNSGVPAKDQLPDYMVGANSRVNKTYNASVPTPYASCTMWHGALKFAFGDELKQAQYTSKYVPDWSDSEIRTGNAYHDDGGVKALVKMKRDANGNYMENAEGYYEWETKNGHPIYSGYRMIFNMGGNIPVNQHQNSNDNAFLLEKLPLGTNNPDNPHDFCIVNFDNFLSPSPRWSDYVLPAATVWEMDNRIGIDLGGNIITPVVTQPPGEAVDTWTAVLGFLKAYEKIDPSKAGITNKYLTIDEPAGTPVIPDEPIINKFKRAYENASKPVYNSTTGQTTYGYKTDSTSKYYGLSFEEALKVQYSNRTPGAEATVNDTKTTLRQNVDNYLNQPAATRRVTAFKPAITGNTGNTTYGHNTFPNDIKAPNVPDKALLYCELYVWQYVNRFRKWHGWISDPAKRGQNNTDPEGDPIILPTMMYFPYEDYFMEAYGGNLPPENNRFLLTTTHDRFRSHSTLAEAPYLREITHRTKGGKVYSGNDWGTYALSEIVDGKISRLNKSIAEKDYRRASWAEIWMNDEDGAAMGIHDGDLIQVENAVGAVRVIARLTKRNVRGYLDLHQGCWYDPDPADGVDDGGCANTLMATKPSRYDHGNGQQSAMVSVKKVNV